MALVFVRVRGCSPSYDHKDIEVETGAVVLSNGQKTFMAGIAPFDDPQASKQARHWEE